MIRKSLIRQFDGSSILAHTKAVNLQ
ncbi:hypothetical protein CPTSV76_062 [Enterobacteria phage SV76]|nr:hypothetical protein CPTSV76_062 [Enterobacteria phage SV76]